MSRPRRCVDLLAGLLLSTAVTACQPQRSVIATQVIKPATFRAAAPPPPPTARAVQIAIAIDRSNRLEPAGRARMTELVRERIARTGYAVDAAPTFVVTPSITAIKIAAGARPRVECQVELRVARVTPTGTEVWTAGQAATATGRATSFHGSARPREVARSIESCVGTALDEVTTRRVLPFLASAAAS